jgi:ligand-binding sensor domain-containing protein/signal transduction histidine kinase
LTCRCKNYVFGWCEYTLNEHVQHGFRRRLLFRCRLYVAASPRWAGCLLWFATLAAVAMPVTDLKLSEYQKQDWQVEDGLPENNVRMIAQRADGTLLLASSAGLASFDGLHFRNIPAEATGITPNEAVNSVLPGIGDELWIGTDGSGVLQHTASGTVNISERAGLFNERVRQLYRDAAGVLWIATQNGVERYLNGHLETIPNTGMISGDITTPFAEDGHGGMFFITSSGLFHWAKGTASRVDLPLTVGDSPVAVYRDQQQRIWVGTMRHVLQLTSTHTGPHDETYGWTSRAAVSSPVTALLGDASGHLWIGTRHEGLWQLASSPNPSPNSISHWTTSQWTTRDGLPDDAVRSLFIDDEQNLWVGMLTGGLSRWRKAPLAPFGAPEGFHANYSSNVLADSHGDLWLGTWDAGLFRKHGTGPFLPTNPPGLPLSSHIRVLTEDRYGHLWVGTWVDGIYRFDGKTFKHYLLGTESPGNAVGAILPTKQGALWVGTYTGLFYFPSGEPHSQQRSQLLNSELITCLLEDKDGSILVGTSTGLYRVRDGRAKPITGLPAPHVLSLTLDTKGYAWASVKGGGLAVVREDHVTAVPEQAGIPDYSINTAVEDFDGHLWLGTSRGIVRLAVNDLHAAVDGAHTQLPQVILGKADGMRSSESGGVSSPGSTLLPDGTMWFVTTKGFVHTTDVAEKLGDCSPNASITGWTLSNDPNDTAAVVSNSPSVSQLDLDAGQPDIRFFFTAKLLSNPNHIQFRYRLNNYDADWTTTRAQTARYYRLPPGHYNFEVQARIAGDQWSSNIASIPVRAYPYFYQTWYFYLALTVAAIAFAVHLFRRRVQMMKGRIGIVLEERNRIARECHDTLMAGFAAISWQLEATAKLFRDNGAESTPTAASCELARSMVSHCQAEARRIIWDLRDTDEVTNVLSEAIGRTLSASQLRDTIETSFIIEGDEVPLAPGCVHHLVCIGQEAISNALHHADPTHIAIRLLYEKDSLSLSIRDNGCGFTNHGPIASAGAARSRTGHFGIPVMEERARKLGGNFRLQSSTGAGTEVTVRVGFHALQVTNQEQHVIRWIGI